MNPDLISFEQVGAFVVILGLLVGSFLNVVIYRLPEGLSIVHPRSRCPSCTKTIGAFDNIPVLSWMWLRGRCRNCSWSIPARYPFIEALTGLLFFLVYVQCTVDLHQNPALFAYTMLHGVLFMGILLAVSVIDLDHMIIPDSLSLGGAMVGVALAFVAADGTGVSWQMSAIGAATGAGILLTVALVYQLVRGREGMGMGDVKLMAMLGAFLGLESIPFLIFGAAIQGTVFALVFLFLGGTARTVHPDDEEPENDEMDEGDADDEGDEPVGQMMLPFGPFLALAGLEWYLFQDVLAAYNPYVVAG
jgi:leader peptidase (prepilin peptidase)/N-methyltransferase